MTEQEQYKTRRKMARLAGAGYVVVALAALPDSLRKAIFVSGDPVATGHNVLANLLMFRLSIVGDIATELAFLLTALGLYTLLKEVRQGAARAMLSLVVIAVTMAYTEHRRRAGCDKPL